jgi:hypothetical protein
LNPIESLSQFLSAPPRYARSSMVNAASAAITRRSQEPILGIGRRRKQRLSPSWNADPVGSIIVKRCDVS